MFHFYRFLPGLNFHINCFLYFVLECRCFLNIDRESDEFENAANERIVHGAIGASSGVQLFAHDSLRPRFAQKLRLFPAHGEDAK